MRGLAFANTCTVAADLDGVHITDLDPIRNPTHLYTTIPAGAGLVLDRPHGLVYLPNYGVLVADYGNNTIKLIRV